MSATTSHSTTGFASYAPSAKVTILAAVLGTSTPLTAMGEDLVAAAMTDLRQVEGLESILVESRSWPCNILTPSDFAAARIGPRIRITYDCSFSPSERAQIIKSILAKRGTTRVW